MTTQWILRFVGYGSSIMVDGFFHDGARAETTYREALAKAETGERLAYTDDFGYCVAFDPRQGAIVLVNTEAMAKMQAHNKKATDDAAKGVGWTPDWTPKRSSAQ